MPKQCWINFVLATSIFFQANSFQGSSSFLRAGNERANVSLGRIRRSSSIGPCFLPRCNNPTHNGLFPISRSSSRLFSQQSPTKVSDSEIIGSTSQQLDESESKLLEIETPLSEYAPILALCWFVALLSALDRVAMSVAILPLSTEYYLTDTAKGAISSVFSVGYGLGIIPAGLLVASVSPRLVMAGGVTLWSLATFGTPIAANLIHLVQDGGSMSNAEIATSVLYVAENTTPLLIMRSVMGAAESVVLPTIQRMLANWVPSSKKSLSIAAVYSGFQIGTVCAYLLSPWVMDNVGWRGLFYVYGGVGALWLIPWWLLAKDSPKASLETASLDTSNASATVSYGDSKTLVNELKEKDAKFIVEQRLVDENGEEAFGVVDSEITSWEEAQEVFKDAPWKEILTSKSAWAVTIAHAANNWGVYNMLSWAPTFYAEQYGLNVKESAFLSILPSIAGAVGGLIAGYTADKIMGSFVEDDNVEKRTLVRRGFQSLALFGPASFLLMLAYHIPEDPTVTQFLLTGAVGFAAFNAAGYSAAPQEKAGEKWAGLLYSITTLPGVVFGSVGVYITGQILDLTNQNWTGVWSLNGAIDIIGGLAFLALYDSRREFE